MNGELLTPCPMRGVGIINIKQRPVQSLVANTALKPKRYRRFENHKKRYDADRSTVRSVFKMSLTQFDKKRVADDYHRKRYGDPEDVP